MYLHLCLSLYRERPTNEDYLLIKCKCVSIVTDMLFMCANLYLLIKCSYVYIYIYWYIVHLYNIYIYLYTVTAAECFTLSDNSFLYLTYIYLYMLFLLPCFCALTLTYLMSAVVYSHCCRCYNTWISLQELTMVYFFFFLFLHYLAAFVAKKQTFLYNILKQ